MPISRLVRIFRVSTSVRPLAAAGLAACAFAFSSAPLQTLVANGDTRDSQLNSADVFHKTKS